MAGLTLILMRYAIIAPILSVYEMNLQLEFSAFLAYVVATMLLAASGYAINDYYDRNLDLINRKADDVVVGNKIPAQRVLLIYRILNLVALILAAYAAYKSGIWLLFFCFPVMIGLLYYYTTTYKKQLLTGNIIVSIATALVPVAVYLFEMPPVINHYRNYIISGAINTGVISGWIFGFAIFAFLSGLAREIIKDMEDFEGDKFAGRDTVPIVWGLKWAKGITISLLSMVFLGIVLIFVFYFSSSGKPDFITLSYFTAFLLIPLGYEIFQLVKSKTVADYKFCGDLLKLIMLAGVLYAPIVWYIIQKTFES